MKIRWIGPPVDGGFHNSPRGVRRGQVIDTDGDDYVISEVSLRDYLVNGLAEVVAEPSKVKSPVVEKAVAPQYETAKLDVPADPPAPPKLEAVPEPLDEPEPEHKTRPPVRRPRR